MNATCFNLMCVRALYMRIEFAFPSDLQFLYHYAAFVLVYCIKVRLSSTSSHISDNNNRQLDSKMCICVEVKWEIKWFEMQIVHAHCFELRRRIAKFCKNYLIEYSDVMMRHLNIRLCVHRDNLAVCEGRWFWNIMKIFVC